MKNKPNASLHERQPDPANQLGAAGEANDYQSPGTNSQNASGQTTENPDRKIPPSSSVGGPESMKPPGTAYLFSFRNSSFSSNRILARFARPYPYNIFKVNHEYLAVSDFAGTG